MFASIESLNLKALEFRRLAAVISAICLLQNKGFRWISNSESVLVFVVVLDCNRSDHRSARSTKLTNRFHHSADFANPPIDCIILDRSIDLISSKQSHRPSTTDPNHRSDSTDRPFTMAQYLPDPLLIEIFKHLGLVNLTRARAVCRKWRALIDSRVRIEELAICSKAISEPTKWFHLNEKVDPDNWLELDVTGSGFSKFNQTIVRLHLLASLKRLMIVREGFESTDGYGLCRLVSRLAKFAALVHLEISACFDAYDGWMRCNLVHPNLRVLSLGYSYDPELFFEIDCPRLEVLECIAPFTRFAVTYPETIKQLYYYQFRDSLMKQTANLSQLEAFANVEFYKCDSIRALEQVNIWSMPKLRELRVEETIYWYEKCLPRVRNILTDLIAKKESLDPARHRPLIYLNDERCSANLKASHPYLFSDDEDLSDEDSRDDEYPAFEEATVDEDTTQVKGSMEADSSMDDEWVI